MSTNEERLRDVVNRMRAQFRLAGIRPQKDSMNPAEHLLWMADESALAALPEAASDERLRVAVIALMRALEPELTGLPMNVPKSSWAGQWEEVESALAALPEASPRTDETVLRIKRIISSGENSSGEFNGDTELAIRQIREVLAAVPEASPRTHRAIISEIYRSLEILGADNGLLGTVNSWGDSLPDEDVLANLRGWNLDSDPLLHETTIEGLCAARDDYHRGFKDGVNCKCSTCSEKRDLLLTAAVPEASEPPRCPICDWPLKQTVEEGCVPGNCSYRPHEGTAEYHRIEERKRRLAAPLDPRGSR